MILKHFQKHHKSRHVILKILQGTLNFSRTVDRALDLGAESAGNDSLAGAKIKKPSTA